MKRTLKAMVRLLFVSAFSISFISCGNSNSYSSYDETNPEETYVDEFDCVIHIDDYESTIIMNRDETAQLIEGGETLYGSWNNFKNLGWGTEVTFNGRRGRIHWFIKDDYLYFDRNAAKANDPTNRYHITRTPKR